MVVLSLIEGFVNDSNLLTVLPSIINRELTGPITPLNDCAFLLPMKSREEVKDLCRLGTFAASTEDSPCKLQVSPWSAEMGAVGRKSREGQWIHIWNLPLHAWCWSIIAKVLSPVGELVAISQAELPHIYFISVLVRRQAGVALPLELDFNMGMRKYQVLFMDDRGALPVFRRDMGRYVLTAKEVFSWAKPGTEVQLETEEALARKMKGKVMVKSCSHSGPRGTQDKPERAAMGADPERDLGAKLLPVVERCSHGGDEAGVPVVRDAMRQTDGSSEIQGRTDGHRRARPPERRPAMSEKWVKSQRTAEQRVECGDIRQVETLKQVKVGTRGNQIASEVFAGQIKDGDVHVKDRGDQFKARHASGLRDTDYNVPPEQYVSAGPSSVKSNKEKLGQVKEAQVTLADDPIALLVGPCSNMAHDPHWHTDSDPGDPLLMCDVGHQVGPYPMTKAVVNSGGDLALGDRVASGSRGLHDSGVNFSLSKLKEVNYKDISAAPTLEPPLGFLWQFLAGVWVLVPVDVPVDSGRPNEDELLYDGEGEDGSEAHSTEALSKGVEEESDDSVFEFERNL